MIKTIINLNFHYTPPIKLLIMLSDFILMLTLNYVFKTFHSS